jgi:hypothetical protein
MSKYNTEEVDSARAFALKLTGRSSITDSREAAARKSQLNYEVWDAFRKARGAQNSGELDTDDQPYSGPNEGTPKKSTKTSSQPTFRKDGEPPKSNQKGVRYIPGY